MQDGDRNTVGDRLYMFPELGSSEVYCVMRAGAFLDTNDFEMSWVKDGMLRLNFSIHFFRRRQKKDG